MAYPKRCYKEVTLDPKHPQTKQDPRQAEDTPKNTTFQLWTYECICFVLFCFNTYTWSFISHFIVPAQSISSFQIHSDTINSFTSCAIVKMVASLLFIMSNRDELYSTELKLVPPITTYKHTHYCRSENKKIFHYALIFFAMVFHTVCRKSNYQTVNAKQNLGNS